MLIHLLKSSDRTFAGQRKTTNKPSTAGQHARPMLLVCSAVANVVFGDVMMVTGVAACVVGLASTLDVQVSRTPDFEAGLELT
jgi:hypothetical protein